MKKYLLAKKVEVTKEEYITNLKEKLLMFDKWIIDCDKKVESYIKRIDKEKSKYKKRKSEVEEELRSLT